MAWTLTGNLDDYLAIAGGFLRSRPVHNTIQLVALDSLEATGKAQSFGRGRARRWMTPPLSGFTTILLLPAPLPGD